MKAGILAFVASLGAFALLFGVSGALNAGIVSAQVSSPAGTTDDQDGVLDSLFDDTNESSSPAVGTGTGSAPGGLPATGGGFGASL